MSDNICTDANCSVNVESDTATSTADTICMETLNMDDKIESSDRTSISIDEEQTLQTGERKRSMRFKYKRCMPCIRLIVFVSIIIILVLICNARDF